MASRPELPKTYDPAEVEPRLYAPGSAAASSTRSPTPRGRRSSSRCRRRTSPAARTSATARRTRRWTCSRATIACSARTPTGCPAKTTPRSRPRPCSCASSRRKGSTRDGLGPRSVPRARLGVARAVRRRDQRSVPRARVRSGLAARALHAGPRSVGGGQQGLRRPLRRRSDLPRHAAGQLGSGRAVDALGRGGRRRRARHVPVAHPLPRARTAATGSSSRRRGPRRTSPTSRSPCIPTTSATRT